MSMAKPALMLSGTYTLDSLAEVIDYWVDYLDLNVNVRVTPYAQMFQQLLDPASAVRRNQSGANVLLIRWADLVPSQSAAPGRQFAWSDIEPRVAELASALTSFSHEVPCLVVVGPSDRHDPVLERATSDLRVRLASVSHVVVEQGESAMARYSVAQTHDPVSERFGHVPFTSQAITALGTTVARWYAAVARPPVKVVAVDGDHTLWSGVVAEDGVNGIRVEGPHAALQHVLIRQNDSGRLLCLLSKNEESDVRSLFENHAEMPLKWTHFVAHRINWNAKSDNLRTVISDLELGLDSVVFLDDNPMECAEMRAGCPGVVTVRVPTDPMQLALFVDHLWLFDQPKHVTAEDRKRTKMYQENASRVELRRNTDSLRSFLNSLELVVEIVPVSSVEVPRLAQLTQRTNQFNASLLRFNETEVGQSIAAPGVFHHFVRARDRFGDYGIVGQVRGIARGSRLEVDLFMLSCRALGRGIEHQMLAGAAKHAVLNGLEEVAVLFRRGDRNAPVRRFLEGVFKAKVQSDEQWFELPVHTAASLVFDASMTGDESEALDQPDQRAGLATPQGPDVGARFEHIAHSLTNSAQIERAMGSRIRPTPDLGSSYVAPAVGLERDIASIWQEVLRVAAVGVHDRFQDLGGKSIHLVQVHRLLLDRMNVEVDITTMFQHATVSSLAAGLSERPRGSAMAAAQSRGSKMREARARAGGRLGRGE